MLFRSAWIVAAGEIIMLIKKTAFAVLALSLVMAPVQSFAKEAQAVEVKSKGAFKGASRIAIAAFNVGFIFESTDQTKKTGGMLGAFGGTTKAKSQLVGVTPAMMQQITDAAYADFVAQMAATGIGVIPPAEVFADPNFAKVKTRPGPTEIGIQLEKGSKGKAAFYKPTALPAQVLLGTDFAGSGLGSIGLNMSAGQNGYLLGTYAKATNVPVVDVTYLIDFSQQQRPGAFSFSGIKVNANLGIVPTYSKLTVIGVTGQQDMLTLGQPVSVDGDFIEVTGASSGADKTLQSAANIGAAAMGLGVGGMFGKTRKFTFTAKPGNYEAGATKAASLANARLIGQLLLLR